MNQRAKFKILFVSAFAALLALAAALTKETKNGESYLSLLVQRPVDVKWSGLSEKERIQAKMDYPHLLKAIEQRRKELAFRWKSAWSEEKKREALRESRHYLRGVLINDLFPFWEGTEYDFNGTTEIPKNGKVACGYLVTTTLKHSGFNLNRYALARAASLHMIRSLSSPREQFAVSTGRSPVESLIAKLKQTGPGLYVAGLDSHTGFVIYDGSGIHFFHADWNGVVKEPARRSFALIHGSERGIHLGKLLGDDMLIKWLEGEVFHLVMNNRRRRDAAGKG